MTVGRASLSYLVWSRQNLKTVELHSHIQRLTNEKNLLVWPLWLACSLLSVLSSFIVDLVFSMLRVYTCHFWAR